MANPFGEYSLENVMNGHRHMLMGKMLDPILTCQWERLIDAMQWFESQTYLPLVPGEDGYEPANATEFCSGEWSEKAAVFHRFFRMIFNAIQEEVEKQNNVSTALTTAEKFWRKLTPENMKDWHVGEKDGE